MKRLVLLLAVFAGLALSVSLFAADLPVVRQPNDPAFSAADRSALSAAWTAIETQLRPSYNLSQAVRSSGRQWLDADYAQFVAGALQSAGYTALLATGTWAGATRTWVLVGVPVSLGLAYLPVEAAPSLLTSNSAIGQIAWQGGASGTTFDTRYLSFSQAVALSPNVAPAVVLTTEKYAVVDETTTFQILGTGLGAIFFCYWDFGDGTRITDARLTFWYTFRETGNVTVNVAVFDVRGARTDLSITVDVLAEKPDCGCGH